MEAERASAKRSRSEAELQLALVSRQHFADLSLLPQLVLGRACRGRLLRHKQKRRPDGRLSRNCVLARFQSVPVTPAKEQIFWFWSGIMAFRRPEWHI